MGELTRGQTSRIGVYNAATGTPLSFETGASPTPVAVDEVAILTQTGEDAALFPYSSISPSGSVFLACPRLAYQGEKILIAQDFFENRIIAINYGDTEKYIYGVDIPAGTAVPIETRFLGLEGGRFAPRNIQPALPTPAFENRLGAGVTAVGQDLYVTALIDWPAGQDPQGQIVKIDRRGVVVRVAGGGALHEDGPALSGVLGLIFDVTRTIDGALVFVEVVPSELKGYVRALNPRDIALAVNGRAVPAGEIVTLATFMFPADGSFIPQEGALRDADFAGSPVSITADTGGNHYFYGGVAFFDEHPDSPEDVIMADTRLRRMAPTGRIVTVSGAGDTFVTRVPFDESQGMRAPELSLEVPLLGDISTLTAFNATGSARFEQTISHLAVVPNWRGQPNTLVQLYALASPFHFDLGDSDGDGLTDRREIAIAQLGGGSCPDPDNADSDGDGYPDLFEYQYGKNPCDGQDNPGVYPQDTTPPGTPTIVEEFTATGTALAVVNDPRYGEILGTRLDSIQLVGDAESLSTVSVTGAMYVVAVPSTGSWQTLPGEGCDDTGRICLLQNQVNTLDVTARDAAGNVSYRERRLVLHDNIPPELNVSTQAQVCSSTTDINAQTEAYARLSLEILPDPTQEPIAKVEELFAPEGGVWRFKDVPLRPQSQLDTNYFMVRSVDAVGNEATQMLGIQYDDVAPTLVINEFPASAADLSVRITGEISRDASLQYRIREGDETGNILFEPTSFTMYGYEPFEAILPVSGLLQPNQPYTAELWAVDRCDRESGRIFKPFVKLNTQAIEPPVLDPITGPITAFPVTITGTKHPSDSTALLVTYTTSTGTFGPVTVAATSGIFSFPLPTAGVSPTDTISVSARAKGFTAGLDRLSEASNTITFDVAIPVVPPPVITTPVSSLVHDPDDDLVFTGNGKPGATVYVYGADAVTNAVALEQCNDLDVDDNGAWTCTVSAPIAPGLKRFFAVQGSTNELSGPSPDLFLLVAGDGQRPTFQILVSGEIVGANDVVQGIPTSVSVWHTNANDASIKVLANGFDLGLFETGRIPPSLGIPGVINYEVPAWTRTFSRDGLNTIVVTGKSPAPHNVAGFAVATFTLANVQAPHYEWSGAGADNLWSNAHNWLVRLSETETALPGQPPTPYADVAFPGNALDPLAAANKACSVDISTSVESVSMGSPYQGTVTVAEILGVGQNLVVLGGALHMAGGANNKLYIQGSLELDGTNYGPGNVAFNAGTGTEIHIEDDFRLLNADYDPGTAAFIFEGEGNSEISRPDNPEIPFHVLAADKRYPLARIGAPEGQEQNLVILNRLGVEGRDFVGALMVWGTGQTMTLRESFELRNSQTSGSIFVKDGATLEIANGVEVSFSGLLVFSAVGTDDDRATIESEDGIGTYYSLELGGVVALRYVDILDLAASGLHLTGSYDALVVFDDVLVDRVEAAGGSTYLSLALTQLPDAATLQGIHFGTTTEPYYAIIASLSGEILSIQDVGIPEAYLGEPSRLLRVDSGGATLFAATATPPSFPYVFDEMLRAIGMVEWPVYDIAAGPLSNLECRFLALYSDRKVICSDDFLTIKVEPLDGAPVPKGRTAVPAVLVEWVGRQDVPLQYATVTNASEMLRRASIAAAFGVSNPYESSEGGFFVPLTMKDIKARGGRMRVFVTSDQKDDFGHVGLLSIYRQGLFGELTPVVEKRLVPFFGHHETIDKATGIAPMVVGDSVHAVAGLREGAGTTAAYPTPIIMQGCVGEKPVHKVEWGNGLVESVVGFAASPKVSDKLATIEFINRNDSPDTPCEEPRFIVGPVLDLTSGDLINLNVVPPPSKQQLDQALQWVNYTYPMKFYFNDRGARLEQCPSSCQSCNVFPPHENDVDCDGLGENLEYAVGTCAHDTAVVSGLDCSANSHPAHGDLPYRVVDTSDTDGDGLLDGWETIGVRRSEGDAERKLGLQKDGTTQSEYDSNLVALGVDPLRKDVLVQCTYWVINSTADVRLPEDAVSAAQQFYGSQPIPNPSGQDGIKLYYEQYPNRCFGDVCPGDPANWPCDPGQTRPCGLQQARHWRNKLDRSRWGVFHWCSLFNGSASSTPSVNHSHLGGNSATVPGMTFSIGAVRSDTQNGQSYRSFYDFAILIHELGHNFGLHHGGGNGTNCKPNYPSLMNYAYSYSFLKPGGGCAGYNDFPALVTLQFSEGGNSQLDENGLKEWQGIPPNSPTKNWVQCYNEESGITDYFRWTWAQTQEPGAIDWTLELEPGTPELYIRRSIDPLVVKNIRACESNDPERLVLHDHNDFKKITESVGAGIFPIRQNRFSIPNYLPQYSAQAQAAIVQCP